MSNSDVAHYVIDRAAAWPGYYATRGVGMALIVAAARKLNYVNKS